MRTRQGAALERQERRPACARRALLRALAGPLVLPMLAACAAASPRRPVRLGVRVPLAAVRLPNGEEGTRLRVAIAGVLSPVRTLETYRGLLAYMEQRLGQRVELVQRPTYIEVNRLLREQDVQVGFVCTLAYVLGQREFGLELLAAPLVDGRPEYFSLLIVPAGSPASSLADLRGARFAFTDPLSNSGRLVPTVQLHRLGTTPQQFFSRTVYTYSHDNSILAVADGLMDAAAVDSLVYEGLVRQQPELGPPVVAPPGLEQARREALRLLLLDMDQDAAGRAVLAALGVERFVAVPDSIYDGVRQMADLEAQT